METALIGSSILVCVGALSQVFAWRFNVPAILIMTAVGILLGPIFGVLDPITILGDLYQPLIAIAVAVILFEGSLGLEFREIADVCRASLLVVSLPRGIHPDRRGEYASINASRAG